VAREAALSRARRSDEHDQEWTPHRRQV
jgi:hypothetical protein